MNGSELMAAWKDQMEEKQVDAYGIPTLEPEQVDLDVLKKSSD